MYTVFSIFNTALRSFSGASRDSFRDPNGTIADALRTVSRNVDLIESKRVVPLLPALYTGDNLYMTPPDVNTIIDISPAGGRSSSEMADFEKTDPLSLSRDFNFEKINFTEEYRNGVKLLRIQPGQINDLPKLLHDCNSMTDSGAVTASGDASNLDINQVFYINGVASLDFDIVPSSGNAFLTFELLQPVDITTTTRDGSFTLAVFIPEELTTKLTSLSLRVGSSASDYYTMTATSNTYGGAFTHGFNIIRFIKRDATQTGTVVESAIDYLRVGIAHTATTTIKGVKIDAIAAHKGLGYNISYYSNYHFVSETTGAFLLQPTNIGLLDKVILANESYDLVVNEAKKIMDMELHGESGGAVYKLAERELRGIWGDFGNPGLYEQYRLRYPSERRSVITSWT